MIDPPGWKPPPTVAVSLSTTVPTVPPELGLVLNVGEAFTTATVSTPQALEAGLLLASPLKLAVQYQVPAMLAGVVLAVV